VADPRSFVRNAADPKQVQHAGRKERDRQAARRSRLKATMGTPEGRAALMDILEDCRVYESIWHPSAMIHYNAGIQDVGHQLLARLLDADESLYEQMEREGRERRRRLDREIDAAHTARASEGAADHDDRS
jgi:hypothetical protein